MDSIFRRVSVRAWQSRLVEEEKLELLLKAAMTAPSAGNQQPWEFYIVKKRKTLAALAASTPYAGCTKDAPVAIVPCYRKDCLLPEYAQLDLSAATENLLLEAVSLDLGAVWLGIAPLWERMDRVREILTLPRELEAFAIVPCGYPDRECRQEERFDPERVHVV